MIRPNATAFNHVDDGYKGMLVVRSEIKVCVPLSSAVNGVAYIGIIAPKD